MKLAVVVQRYGADLNGGAELHARYVAEHLARHAEVEVLTTCANDYITWRNELDPGLEQVNGVPVRRFLVSREREVDDFGRRSTQVFEEPHSIAAELAWLRSEGPTSPSLISHLRRHGDRYDYCLFFSYRYYHAFHGIRVTGPRALLVPTAERDPALGLRIFRDSFRCVRALMYNSYEERALINAVSNNERVPGVVVGIGSEVPADPEPQRFRQATGIDGPVLMSDQAGLAVSNNERVPGVVAPGDMGTRVGGAAADPERQHAVSPACDRGRKGPLDGRSPSATHRSWLAAGDCLRLRASAAPALQAGLARGQKLIYVGRIDENKGCRELFDYFQRYARVSPPLTLVLAGNPVMPIPAHPRIRHLGYVTDREKFDAIAAADVLVMPSYYESLSMVTLEAWALGRPVLVNGRCDVLCGQCIRSNAGLFYESYEEFAETLHAIVGNSTLRSALGGNGRAYFDAHYTWPVIERKYLDMLDRLEREDAGEAKRPEPLPGWFDRRRHDVPPGRQEVDRLPTGPASES